METNTNIDKSDTLYLSYMSNNKEMSYPIINGIKNGVHFYLKWFSATGRLFLVGIV